MKMPIFRLTPLAWRYASEGETASALPLRSSLLSASPNSH
jgi:hypothetical protein